MTAQPQTAPGKCRECGTETDHGRIVGNQEQVSGPGMPVIVCPGCDLAPDVETAAGFCEDCGLHVHRGIVLGDVCQGSGGGSTPVLCKPCIQGRRQRAAKRDQWLRQTDRPGRGPRFGRESTTEQKGT